MAALTPWRQPLLTCKGPFAYSLFALLPAGPSDSQVLQELGQRHKLTFVGPSIPMRLGLV